jgi:flagellar FliL protein
MATPDKSQQDPKADAAAPPKKKRGKLFIIIGVLFVLAGGGGGAGWYFMRPLDPNAPKVAEKPKPSIFVPLESFTVNLAPADGQSQYIQTALTLKVEESEAADLIKERMPQVRDRVLMVLSSKKGPDLLHTQGKQKLAAEISEAVRTLILPAMKPVAAPAKEAAAQVSPVATAQAADAPPAEADKPADAKSADAKPVRQGPAVDVLFTAFIIQ